MENLDFIIFISLVIFYFLFNKPNKPNKPIKINNIDTNNIYINDDQNYKKQINIKNNTEKEIIQLNIEKGKITRQSILDESGGSIHYNNLSINSIISGNKIKQNNNYTTYAKLPNKINLYK